ncbi:hypothetical protein CEP54_004021 [Fusarium duplospermum]|uniref:Protein kinase domain-containing protein n=1 Tax=Fusarium duplospermum TaxID=1325734 RepID=A0A428QKN6_9HYPO|nr:hypothetical protein CEP54_004021 [Fusarium duplospermum]
MSWEESNPNEFLERFEKRKQPSNIPSIDPLPDDNQISKRRKTFSERSGSSSHVYDYGRSQSDLMSPLSSQSGTNDTSLLEVDTRDPSTLANSLCTAMVPHFGDKTKGWLPRTKLSQLCQRSIISRELKKVFPESDVPIYLDYVLGNRTKTTKIRGPARIIFAILVLIKETDKLGRFFEAGFCDEDLPFIFDADGILLSQGRPDNQSSKRKTCFMKEDTSLMRSFHREQWQINVPFIYRPKKNRVLEYQLHSETIMPWTSREPVKQNGGFAKVYKVQIHPDHHAFFQDGHDTFALKVLCCTNQETYHEEFQRELYALRKTPPGPHVIELLATFKRGEEFSFLFPWADGGNLTELMNKEPSELLGSRPDASRILTRWLAKQCAGIAKGLRGMHNAKPKFRSNDDSDKDEWKDNYGIHGDLKPENILRFKGEDLGELKLSDFGLTKFHTIATRSKQPGNGPMSPTYASPEQTKDFLYVSRRSDVWALGCVFSMLLTWAIRGPAAVKAYDKARHDEKDPGRKRTWYEDTFYGTEHDEDGEPLIPDGFFLKKAVIECIEENKRAISGPDSESNYLTEFLDFIRDKMLEIDSDKRVTSEIR